MIARREGEYKIRPYEKMQKYLQKIKDVVARKKISDFEIYLKRSRGVSLTVKDQTLDASENEMSLGFGLRVRMNGKGHLPCRGFSFGRAFDENSIGLVVDQAVAASRAVTPDTDLGLPPGGWPRGGWPCGKSNYSPVQNYDPDLGRISLEEKMKMALTLEGEAMAFDAKIRRVRHATYHESIDEVCLFNSSGLDVSHQKSGLCLSLMPVAESGGASEMFYDFVSTPFWQKLDPVRLARSTAKMAVDLLGGKRIPNYRGPVILHPAVAVALLEVFAPGTTAENVHKKNSSLVGKMGKKLYSSALTIIDDGLYSDGEETRPFDDEGTPSQKTVVINKGVVAHLLYDFTWGRKEGVPSTGNANRKSAVSLPQIDFTNFYLVPGTKNAEELLKIDRGILITEVIGMHTADPISGDFSVGMAGFLVEKGERKPIRSMALTGNLHEFFSKIIDVGSDLRFYGQFGAPTVLIEEASVSGE